MDKFTKAEKRDLHRFFGFPRRIGRATIARLTQEQNFNNVRGFLNFWRVLLNDARNTERNELREVRREIRNDRQRQRRQRARDTQRILSDELTVFLDNIDIDYEPKVYKFKETARPTGDFVKTYYYKFNSIPREFVVSLVNNVELSDDDDRRNLITDFFFNQIKQAYILSYFQRFKETSYYRVLIVNNARNADDENGDGIERESKTISTKFLRYDLCLADTRQKLKDFIFNYDGTYPDDFWIEVFFANPLYTIGAGSTTRSINQAKMTWKIVNIPTRTNCLYTAVSLARNKNIYKELLEDTKRLNDMSKHLKKYIKDKGHNIKKLVSDDKEAQLIADITKYPIHIYNNSYRRIKEFIPVSANKDKRTKPKSPLEIQLINGHFMAMLRLKDINEEPQTESEDTEQCETEILEDMIIEKSKKSFKQNLLYASYDIEATTYNEYHKAYAVGFSWNDLSDDEPKLSHRQYWGLDCQEKFIKFLHQNIQYFHNYTIYAHNGGKYDFMNLFREALLESNLLFLDVSKCVELNGRIISFVITDGDNKITFRDSMCIFAGQSLKDVCKSLDVEHQKLTETVNHDEINISNYHTFPQLKKYLLHDCHGLLESILKFADANYKATKINLSQIFTGATLSKKFFYNNYYNSVKRPIYFMTKDKDKFIRKSYFGGRNEAFHIGYIKGNIYYYDFTSLYPSEGRRPLPYGKPEWVEDMSREDFKSFFGFCDVNVRSLRTDKKPIHATIDNNRLMFQHYNDWTTMRLFSEEIKLGMSKGIYEYDFTDCKGIKFLKYPILKSFFEDCFKRKQDANYNEVLRQIYKIIANSGYGFWGLRVNDRDGVVISESDNIELYEYLRTGKLINYCDYGKYCVMRVEKDLDIQDFNVSIASAITSYARMRLWNLMNDVEQKEGCKIYYCDTDSIITNCDITKYTDLMNEYIWDKTGDDLGSLKNEALDKLKKYNKKADNKVDITEQMKSDNGDICFSEAILAGCKFYAVKKSLITNDTIEMCKLKGYKNDDKNPLIFDDYVKLITKEKESIQQEQTQFNMPKSAMVDEQRRFGLKTVKVNKVFKINYTKGIYDKVNYGEVKPFIK